MASAARLLRTLHKVARRLSTPERAVPPGQERGQIDSRTQPDMAPTAPLAAGVWPKASVRVRSPGSLG